MKSIQLSDSALAPVLATKSASRFLMNLLLPGHCALLVLIFLSTPPVVGQSFQEDASHFQWSTLSSLPDIGGKPHPGFAGAFSGIDNGVLILAGGANFPEAPPWEGGTKRWWDSIYVLEKNASEYRWTDAGHRLERPVAYGVSISLPEGVLCIGGANEEGIVGDIFLLTWDVTQRRVVQRALRQLPPGFEVTAGAEIAGTIYVTGIRNEQNEFLAIRTASLLADAGILHWETLPACPGPPRRLMAYAAQHNGSSLALYLFGGRSERKGQPVALLSDGYSFDILRRKWNSIADIPERDSKKITLMGAPALSYGASSIFILGGDNGALFMERNRLGDAIQATGSSAERDSLTKALEVSFAGHPGFDRTIYQYNTITNTFHQVGILPEAPPVTTNALLWDDQIVITSGEIKPGIRTPDIWIARLNKQTGSFGILNYSLLVIYLVLLVLLGIYFSFRQKTTDDYFKGGGRVPWWAAGLSVFGTALSAITFMAIPAKTYATDWSYFLYNMSVLLVTPFIIYLYIPFFRRLNVTTAYEYLEKRFNVIVRLFGSASFILFQLGRIAIVLYLPAIALNLVSGIDIYLCIITMGLLSLLYTMIGGIEAVIWTDVVQVFVLMGGTILSLIIIALGLDGDVFSLVTTASAYDKFNILDFRMSLVEPTFWVVLLGGFFANLVTYSSDQTMVQRYLTTETERGAARTAWTNAVLVIPASVLFFGTGTALYLYYVQHPQKLDPFAQDLDGIFPWYIVNSLPDGVSGILIAGLFSAAMSSLSSSMNSAATAFTSDFYQRFSRRGDGASLRIAKWSTFVIGLAGTLFALWMSTSNIASLWDHFSKLLGLFTGGLGGLFLLGIMSRKANGTGAIIGLVASSFIQYFVATYTDLHLFLYAAVGLISCVVIGHVASLVINDRSNTEGKQLTVHNKLFGRKR